MDPEWARARDIKPETLGWCHECGTFQRYNQTRTANGRRGLCVNPECDQTWAFDIQNLDETPDEYKDACWTKHADHNDVLYPGSCSCASEQA